MGLAVVGPAGLLALNLRRAPEQGDVAQRPMDRAFILLLLLVSVTGLALLGLRDTAAMAILLAIHLGTVMALFITLPYGKFAHGLFRSAALLKFAIEKRRPNDLGLGGSEPWMQPVSHLHRFARLAHRLGHLSNRIDTNFSAAGDSDAPRR